MTRDEKKLNDFRKGVKLIVLLQATLEAIDDLKGTRLEKQSIRNKMRNLERDIEATIRKPLAQLDKADDTLFTGIQQKVEMICDLSVDELAQLKEVVEEHRKS